MCTLTQIRQAASLLIYILQWLLIQILTLYPFLLAQRRYIDYHITNHIVLIISGLASCRGAALMRRRRYIFVSRGLVPRSGSYPRSGRQYQPFPGGDLCAMMALIYGQCLMLCILELIIGVVFLLCKYYVCNLATACCTIVEILGQCTKTITTQLSTFET